MTERNAKYIFEAKSIVYRWKEIRQIIIKRKSAFTFYEWQRIQEFMNVVK